MKLKLLVILMIKIFLIMQRRVLIEFQLEDWPTVLKIWIFP